MMWLSQLLFRRRLYSELSAKIKNTWKRGLMNWWRTGHRGRKLFMPPHAKLAMCR